MIMKERERRIASGEMTPSGEEKVLPTMQVFSAFTSNLSERKQQVPGSMREMSRKLSADICLIPWHIPQGIGHHVLVEVDTREKIAWIMDSTSKQALGEDCNNQTAKKIRGLLRYLGSLQPCEGTTQGVATEEWRTRWGSSRHQGRTVDCGVFLMINARRIALQEAAEARPCRAADGLALITCKRY